MELSLKELSENLKQYHDNKFRLNGIDQMASFLAENDVRVHFTLVAGVKSVTDGSFFPDKQIGFEINRNDALEILGIVTRDKYEDLKQSKQYFQKNNIKDDL